MRLENLRRGAKFKVTKNTNGQNGADNAEYIKLDHTYVGDKDVEEGKEFNVVIISTGILFYLDPRVEVMRLS